MADKKLKENEDKDYLYSEICDLITDNYEVLIKRTMDSFNQAGDVVQFSSVDSGNGWDTYFRGDSTNPEVGNDIWNLDWIYNNMERGNIEKDAELISMIDEWANFEEDEDELDEGIDMAVALGAAAVASKVHTAYMGYQLGKKYLDKKKHDREVAEPGNWPNRFPLGDDDIELVSESVSINNTKIDTWFERDRSYVGLIDNETEDTIIEWWDEEVQQAVEDGFLNPKDYHSSAVEYANHLGLNESDINEAFKVGDKVTGIQGVDGGRRGTVKGYGPVDSGRELKNQERYRDVLMTSDDDDPRGDWNTPGFNLYKGHRDRIGNPLKKESYETGDTSEKCASCGHSLKVHRQDTDSGPIAGKCSYGSGSSACNCTKFVSPKKESKMRRNEAFMEPEVFQSSGWEVTNKDGVTWWLPDEFGGDGSPEDLEEYNPDNGAIEDVKNVRGWFGRMQASGYLDSTDWYFGSSEAEVMKLLREFQPGDFDDEVDESVNEFVGPIIAGAAAGIGLAAAGSMATAHLAKKAYGAYKNKKKKPAAQTTTPKKKAESTLALNVGNEPIQPFGDSDGPVLIEPDGTGTFSLVHHDEEDNADILESGLSLKEASKLISHYNRMFVSGDFKESKNEGRNTMATISGKRLVEAVARGRNPVQVVSSFLRSRLTEDTDVLQMLSGDDAGGKPLGGADVNNPTSSAQVGPSTPIIPSATTAPIDGETGNADLAKKDDEEGVDSAIGSADGSADSEFMNTSESRLRRKLRVRKRVREALGLTSGEDRPISEERKKRARKARIREAINRIKARRGRRRFNEEEELPDFIKDKIAKGDSEGGSEKDTEKKDGEEDEEDDSEGSEKNFGGGEEKKDDSEKKESYYGAARRNEMKALDNSYQQMRPVGAGRRRGESVNETFRSMMLEAEGSEQDNTAKVQDLDKLPTEKDSENKEAPMESRRRSPRFRSRFRRRTVESETVFPPEKLKGEGFIADLTAGAVDDEDKIEKPESIRRRARARIQERQRGRRRNESVFGTRFEIGERVRVKGGGTGVVVEHADSSGTRGFGYQYLVQMDGSARSQRVTAADLSKA